MAHKRASGTGSVPITDVAAELLPALNPVTAYVQRIVQAYV
jgi:hypothetical protein